MNKGYLAIALLLMLAPAVGAAQPLRSNEACAVLDKLVKKHVWLAATQISMERASVSRRPSDIRPATRHACRRTVEVATRAFGEALAALSMPIGWEPPNPGDYCLSHYLSQCYPGPVPGEPALPPGSLAFVYDAWQGVRDAIQAQMPRGGAHGVAVFSPGSLDAALASRLSESVEGPLYSRYRRR